MVNFLYRLVNCSFSTVLHDKLSEYCRNSSTTNCLNIAAICRRREFSEYLQFSEYSALLQIYYIIKKLLQKTIRDGIMILQDKEKQKTKTKTKGEKT